MLFGTLWRVLLTALIALLFARVDAYVARRGWDETVAGRAYHAYRTRK